MDHRFGSLNLAFRDLRQIILELDHCIEGLRCTLAWKNSTTAAISDIPLNRWQCAFSRADDFAPSNPGSTGSSFEPDPYLCDSSRETVFKEARATSGKFTPTGDSTKIEEAEADDDEGNSLSLSENSQAEFSGTLSQADDSKQFYASGQQHRLALAFPQAEALAESSGCYRNLTKPPSIPEIPSMTIEPENPYVRKRGSYQCSETSETSSLYKKLLNNRSSSRSSSGASTPPLASRKRAGTMPHSESHSIFRQRAGSNVSDHRNSLKEPNTNVIDRLRLFWKEQSDLADEETGRSRRKEESLVLIRGKDKGDLLDGLSVRLGTGSKPRHRTNSLQHSLRKTKSSPVDKSDLQKHWSMFLMN